MKILSLILPALSLVANHLPAVGGEIPPPIAKRGALLFSDDFARAKIGPRWETSQRAFAIVEGALKGGQVRSEHGAIAGVVVPFKDAVIEFRFRFEGSTGLSAVCDDKNFDGSHSGHICRVSITPRLIRLGDDREGGMRNDILEMRKDPARKAEADKLLEGRTATFPMKIEPGQWHHLAMEIVGDEMRVSVDENPAGWLKSPGIGHPTKSRLHFTVAGKDVLLGNVKIWSAEPASAATK